MLVLLHELLESVCLHCLFAFLLEYDAQVFRLCVVHALVVNLFQRIEFFAQRLVVLGFLLVLDGRQLPQVGKLWMQGEDADCRIRIGVGPCVCGRGVVDRQDLQHLLVGLSNPVYHHLQVAEVAHSEASLRAQREHGNQGSGELRVINLEERLVHLVYAYLALFHLRQRQLPVEAGLPQSVALVIGGDEFQFGLFPVPECLPVEVGNPFVVVVFIHPYGVVGLPVAHVAVLAAYEQMLALPELGGAHHEAQRLAVVRGLDFLVVTAVHAVGECRTVEI